MNIEKPPILNEKNIKEIWESWPADKPAEPGWDSWLCQAQRDADVAYYEPIIQQARQETAALFETIEAMYPELREVYWRGKDWQSLKSKYMEEK